MNVADLSLYLAYLPKKRTRGFEMSSAEVLTGSRSGECPVLYQRKDG